MCVTNLIADLGWLCAHQRVARFVDVIEAHIAHPRVRHPPTPILKRSNELVRLGVLLLSRERLDRDKVLKTSTANVKPELDFCRPPIGEATHFRGHLKTKGTAVLLLSIRYRLFQQVTTKKQSDTRTGGALATEHCSSEPRKERNTLYLVYTKSKVQARRQFYMRGDNINFAACATG